LLRPLPSGASKSKDKRTLDIHEDDQLDEAQLPLGSPGEAQRNPATAAID
jgi:hypothetical protein